MNTTFPFKSSKTPSPGGAISATNQKTGGHAASTSTAWRLLVNRHDLYLAAAGGRWYTRRTPLTKSLLAAATHGDAAIGLMAVSASGLSRWTAWDLDDECQLPRLFELARHLASDNHVLLETSRRGAHLFAFHHPTPWSYSHAYGVMLAEDFGLEAIEVYPKHGGLNSLRTPGSCHPKTGVSYLAIDPLTGEVISVESALAAITPITLPQITLPEPEPSIRTGQSNPSKWSNGCDFTDLVQALSHLTYVRIYAPNKAVARCPWHDDRHPSLFIKDDRMHCLSPACGVWGDALDVRRYLTRGIHPPRD